MFVREDDKIFLMGQDVEEDWEPADEEDNSFNDDDGDAGRLREVKRPTDCKDIKKVESGTNYRLILTEEGKLFFSGEDKDEVFIFIESDDDGDDAGNDDDGDDGDN